jgi:hypothetical protein
VEMTRRYEISRDERDANQTREDAFMTMTWILRSDLGDKDWVPRPDSRRLDLELEIFLIPDSRSSIIPFSSLYNDKMADVSGYLRPQRRASA